MTDITKIPVTLYMDNKVDILANILPDFNYQLFLLNKKNEVIKK